MGRKEPCESASVRQRTLRFRRTSPSVYANRSNGPERQHRGVCRGAPDATGFGGDVMLDATTASTDAEIAAIIGDLIEAFDEAIRQMPDASAQASLVRARVVLAQWADLPTLRLVA